MALNVFGFPGGYRFRGRTGLGGCSSQGPRGGIGRPQPSNPGVLGESEPPREAPKNINTGQRTSTCCGGGDHLAVGRFLFPPLPPKVQVGPGMGSSRAGSSLGAPTGIVLQSPEGLSKRALTLGCSARDRCSGWQCNARRLVWGVPPRPRRLLFLRARKPNATGLAAFISDGRGGLGKLGRQVCGSRFPCLCCLVCHAIAPVPRFIKD